MNRSYPVVGTLKSALESFDREFNHLFRDTKEFLTYIMHTEPDSGRIFKRGALNIIGDISNIMFGTATQAQVDAIHDKLHSIESLTERERVLLNAHSQILNVTIREMRSLKSALRRLEAASSLSHQIIRQFSIKTLQIEGEQRM